LSLRTTLVTLKDLLLNLLTVGNLLIRVNTLVGFLTVEEFLEQGLNLRDPGGTTDKDDFVNLFLIDTGVPEALLDGAHGVPEVVHV